LTTNIPYGYKKSETDKNLWEVDEETEPVVKRIYRLCIDVYEPMQIAKILTADSILTPTAYRQLKSTGSVTVEKPCQWAQKTFVGILEKLEYVGHTVNFKTHKKSYKNKKKMANPREEWMIFENTHEPIISQHDFDLVQELRKNKRKIQKHGEVNPFSGMVYCVDCGAKMYLCRSRSMTDEQEHMKCSTYASDSDECSAHFIRTVVLRELVLGELNKLLETVYSNEGAFVNAAMEYASTTQSQEVKKARKILTQSENHIAELDKLFTRLYPARPQIYIYNVLTPEIMHELVEKIVVHAPDKSSGNREQRVEIYFRFNVASATVATLDQRNYDKKERLRRFLRNLFKNNGILLYRTPTFWESVFLFCGWRDKTKNSEFAKNMKNLLTSTSFL
ncbi:MAG: recombinase family protein, partial [Oscillospiraceae bacterium]|nr:recombinase family protein [Oscillospiraceae bacterium]